MLLKLKEIFMSRWVLLATLIIFIILKLPHINHAYYWDESWPYASAVHRMYLHGASLIPGSIDGEISRGHPLMFHFLGALWTDVFGVSKVSLHSYALFISILFLIAIYEAGYRMFNRNVAITALILVAFQQIYFIQSSFVLLEVLLAFLAFISIYFYVTEKFLLTAITLTMLFYTKESGIVLGGVFGIDVLVRLFNKNEATGTKIKRLTAVAIPFMAIGAFFLMQKAIFGWYVLPLYSKGLENDFNSFHYKIRECSKMLFRDDFRYVYYVLIAALGVALVIKSKKLKFLFPLLSGIIIYYFISDDSPTLAADNKVLFIVLYVIVFVIAGVSLRPLTSFYNSKQRRFVLLNTMFALAFIVFSCLNSFVIHRYLLTALIPMLFVAAVYLSSFVQNVSKYAFIPSLLVILSVQAYAYNQSKGIGDIQKGAFDGLYVEEQIAEYMVQHKLQDANIATGGFLETIHLKDPYAGFLNNADTFKNIQWDITYQTNIIIFDNIEPDDRHNNVIADTVNWKRIFRVEKNEAWGEIYERKPAN
ncbi:MAG: glycosyltransferase family 39 protein [Bacteroidetes bacterium]|nr:glycosyltransferase family 39 protein [Bacteroidota bacterium]